MSYQVLYRAWRPGTFSEICGQDSITRTLRRQVTTGRIAHAYLFCGTRGTGKTSAAKVLSKAINCLSPKDGDPCGECEVCRALQAENCMDVVEIDAASNNGVDEIRDLREKIKYPPSLTKYKVYIIDEVHMQVVLGGIGRTADEDALFEIARAAEGAMRDALSLLDCCLSYTDGSVTLELARDVLGSTGRAFLFDFADALIDFDSARALLLINEMVSKGCDPQVFARDVTAHLRALLLAGAVGDISQLLEITPEDAARFSEQATRIDSARLTRLMDLFMRAEPDMKWASRPRTVLELAAVRACHPEREEDSDVSERMDRLEKLVQSGAPRPPLPPPSLRKKSPPPRNPRPRSPSPRRRRNIWTPSKPSVRRFRPSAPRCRPWPSYPMTRACSLCSSARSS